MLFFSCVVYATRVRTYTNLLLQLKLADHAGDRFKERLPGVPAEVLQQAREAVKTIPQGPEARLHLPLMHDGKPVGFAAYKRVGKKGTPVLATILGPDMKPHHSHLLGYPKSANDGHLPEQDVRDFLARVRDEAKEKKLHFFAVADNPLGGASVTVGASPAITNARKAHMRWERKAGIDPKHDWSKTASELPAGVTKGPGDHFVHQTGPHTKVYVHKDHLTDYLAGHAESQKFKLSRGQRAAGLAAAAGLVAVPGIAALNSWSKKDRPVQNKTAANRMAKILDRAQKLAPKSLLGDLSPADLRTMEQAEAILGNKATSQMGLRTLERPKTHFDAYLSTHKPLPDAAAALAEAQNPTTSGDRLKSLLATPHRDVVEAAATNPNVGAHAGLVHSMRPDLVEANQSTMLHRMVRPEEPLPGMSPAELKGPAQTLRDNLKYPSIRDVPEHSPVHQLNRARAGRPVDLLESRHAYGVYPSDAANPYGRLTWGQSSSTPLGRRIFDRYSQREAERYKTAATKTRLYAGLRVRIDRPKGFVQKGKDSQGKSWERTYLCDYGYLAGTQGGDGDGLDVFLGPQEDGKAFLVHQMKEGGGFDEFKLMLGFPDIKSAKAMYTAHVPAKFLGKIQELAVGLIQGLTGRPVDMNKVAQVACGTAFMLGFEAQLKKLA